MERKVPRVEVQGVPGVFGTTAQRRDTTRSSQNGLDEFLTFDDDKQNGIKLEPMEEIETEVTGHVETVESTVESEDVAEEESVDVVFEVNGQKINACMSASMAQMLKESEEMRLQVIDRIMAEAGQNPDQHITVTTGELTSRDTSTVEPPDDNRSEPGTPNITHLNGKTSLGKRPYTSILGGDKKPFVPNKAVTRGSIGIVKPKVEQKLMSTASLRLATTTQKKTGPSMGNSFLWDHKAIVALIECYRSVNDRISILGAARNVDLWNIIGKRMRSRGFQVSDMECQEKFSTLTLSHGKSFKSTKTNCPPSQNHAWDYKPENHEDQTKPTPTKKSIPVITVEDESTSTSDGEGLDEIEGLEDSAKKQKIDADPSNTTQAIDKLRRTYLRVETEKLKEMKASRMLQQEHNRLQTETNETLTLLISLLGQRK